jgi:hypothetical protein
MNTTKLLFVSGFVLAALGACSSSDSSGGAAATTATESDVTTYQQLTSDTQSAATDYRAAMMSSGAAPSSCQSMHDGYDGHVRPWVSQMASMAGHMNDLMDAHGGMMSADVDCTAGGMIAELDHHRSVACTANDWSANQAEASRHVAAMLSYCGHLSDRCGEMMDGFHHGSWGWGGLMDGCAAGMPHDHE